MGDSQASQGSNGAGSCRAGRDFGWDLRLLRAAVSMMSERRNSASHHGRQQPSPQCSPALEAALSKGENARLTHQAGTEDCLQVSWGPSGLVSTWLDSPSLPVLFLSWTPLSKGASQDRDERCL